MSAIAEHPQADGRFWVTETHAIAGEMPRVFTYLADAGTDVDAVMTARAAAIAEELEAAAIAVPDTITSAQARRVVLAAGLREAVEAAVAGADQATQDLWYAADTITRASPVLNALGAAIGLSSAQLDNLFRQAARL